MSLTLFLETDNFYEIEIFFWDARRKLKCKSQDGIEIKY